MIFFMGSSVAVFITAEQWESIKKAPQGLKMVTRKV